MVCHSGCPWPRMWFAQLGMGAREPWLRVPRQRDSWKTLDDSTYAPNNISEPDSRGVLARQSVISSMGAPASRFSNTADTGIRVSRNTHAPLNLPGTLSTAEH